jgi:hypothetical protein
LRADLDSGKDLGMPNGVLINGKGPYRYNTTLVPDGLPYETIKVDPGMFFRHEKCTFNSLHSYPLLTCFLSFGTEWFHIR